MKASLVVTLAAAGLCGIEIGWVKVERPRPSYMPIALLLGTVLSPVTAAFVVVVRGVDGVTDRAASGFLTLKREDLRETTLAVGEVTCPLVVGSFGPVPLRPLVSAEG